MLHRFVMMLKENIRKMKKMKKTFKVDNKKMKVNGMKKEME